MNTRTHVRCEVFHTRDHIPHVRIRATHRNTCVKRFTRVITDEYTNLRVIFRCHIRTRATHMNTCVKRFTCVITYEYANSRVIFRYHI